jgi:hypothetical protein
MGEYIFLLRIYAFRWSGKNHFLVRESTGSNISLVLMGEGVGGDDILYRVSGFLSNLLNWVTHPTMHDCAVLLFLTFDIYDLSIIFDH